MRFPSTRCTKARSTRSNSIEAGSRPRAFASAFTLLLPVVLGFGHASARTFGEFADDSYDLVVVSQTLQATRHPDRVLAEVGRIAGRGIVSVPNFGLWKHRAGLLLRGRMPVSAELPHPWYDTPNIHLATLADLEDLFDDQGFDVRRRELLDAEGRSAAGLRARGPANLMASGAVYLVASRP